MSIYKVNAALLSGYQMMDVGLPTYYETRDSMIGDPRPDNRWAAVFNMPADRTVVTLGEGGYDEIVGVFQIDFHVPENTGTAALHHYADAAMAYFVAGTHLLYLGQDVLIRRAVPSPIRKSDGTHAITVSVYWMARVQRGTPATGGTSIPGGDPNGGASSGTDYEFIQSTPATEWVINHNLGRKVAVEVYDSGGREVWADVINTSANQTRVYFTVPQAGYAIIN